MNARSRALWTKLRIMLYSLDGDSSTPFSPDDSKVGVTVPNPAGPNPVTPEDFLRWCYVEDADFDAMAMTAQGTVICHCWRTPVLFADQEALETGFMLLCELHDNGQILEQARVWPPTIKLVYERMIGLGKRLEGLVGDGMVLGIRSVGP